MCDRIAIIKNGQIIATFTMDELEQRQQGKSLEDFFLEITADKNETEIPIVTESDRKERVRARVLEEYRKFIDAKTTKK